MKSINELRLDIILYGEWEENKGFDGRNLGIEEMESIKISLRDLENLRKALP